MTYGMWGGDVYQKIMLTNDGSEVAALAIPHVVTVAKGAGAPVVVVQVVDSVAQLISRMTPMIEPVPSGEMTVDLAEDIERSQQAAAEENLGKVKSYLESQGISNVSTHVASGVAGDAIIEAANELGCDLIVMATHGRSGIGRVLLGSVADHVVRNAKQAVLLVRAQS